MNLVNELWIPVVKIRGIKSEASLLDIFLSGTAYADLVVRPHERVALMRLFICIAHAALNGPENIKQWEKVPKELPARAAEYLTKSKWKDSFNLFDPEKPFLQIAGLVTTKDTEREKDAEDSAELKSACDRPAKKPSTSIMNFSLATGNNTTLFDHAGDDTQARSLTQGKIALSLIAFQNFSPGGGASTVKWLTAETKQVGSLDAPCLKMYHAFLRGTNLAETIHLNLLTRSTVHQAFGNDGWGKPIWEQMPSGPADERSIANATSTYLGRLVPLARWIKLLDQRWMIWGRGFDYPIFPNFRCPEPSATSIERKDKQGQIVRGLLKASHDRGIWRALASLIVKRKANDVGGALALQNIPDHKAFDIHVCALLRNQATIEAFQESIFHIPAGMTIDIGRKIYEDEVKYAEVKARILGLAVEKWRREMDPDLEQKLKAAGKDKKKLWERLCSIATNHFWTAIERSLPLLLTYTSSFGEDDNDKRKKIWRRAVSRSARESYELACSRESPRQLRAFTLGLRILEGEGKRIAEEQED